LDGQKEARGEALMEKGSGGKSWIQRNHKEVAYKD
jgi:hypothetical protein